MYLHYFNSSPTPNIEIGPTVTAQASTAKAAASTDVNTADDEKLAKEKLNVNTASPTTTLQIRLADGSRLAAQFNLNHTVGDIHTFIQT